MLTYGRCLPTSLPTGDVYIHKMSSYRKCLPTQSVYIQEDVPTYGSFLPTEGIYQAEISGYRRCLSADVYPQEVSAHRRCLYLQKVSSYRWCLAKESDYSQKVLSTILTFSCSKVGSNWISPDSLMAHVMPQTRHFIGKPASTIAMQAALIAHESNFGC